MSTTYTPRSDSLPARVIAFFQRNPDEELSLEDITSKFDTTRGNIHTNLGLAVDAGMLVRDRNVDGDYIYKAGKKLPKPTGVDMDTVHHRPPPAGPQGPWPVRKAARASVDLPDPQDVAIEDDVPVPPTRTKKRDWLPLLKRLQVKQSASLPLAAQHMLGVAITQAHKDQLGTFTTRRDVQAQTIRVWRIA